MDALPKLAIPAAPVWIIRAPAWPTQKKSGGRQPQMSPLPWGQSLSSAARHGWRMRAVASGASRSTSHFRHASRTRAIPRRSRVANRPSHLFYPIVCKRRRGAPNGLRIARPEATRPRRKGGAVVRADHGRPRRGGTCVAGRN